MQLWQVKTRNGIYDRIESMMLAYRIKLAVLVSETIPFYPLQKGFETLFGLLLAILCVVFKTRQHILIYG